MAYDAVLKNQVWLQTDQQCRRYNRNSHVLNLHFDIDLEHSNLIFPQNTLAYDAA